MDFEPEKIFLRSAPSRGLFFDLDVTLAAGEGVPSTLAFAGACIFANIVSRRFGQTRGKNLTGLVGSSKAWAATDATGAVAGIAPFEP